RGGIEGDASPLGPTVHAREENRALGARRVVLAALAERLPYGADGLLSLGRALRDQVLGELLARERRRQRRQQLRGRRAFGGHVRRPRRHLAPPGDQARGPGG